MIDVPSIWHPSPSRQQNQYMAFRSKVHVPVLQIIRIRAFGCDAYRLYVNGEQACEGPARFAKQQPEYDEIELRLPAGEHVIVVIAHYYGVATRITSNQLPAFVQVQLLDERGKELQLHWQCRELDAYLPVKRRVNGQLGWMEYCDIRILPDLLTNDDELWCSVQEVHPWQEGETPHYIRTEVPCKQFTVQSELLEEGRYLNRFGYEHDDPPVRFMLRDLVPVDFEPDGVWLRFDIGKIGLYRPVFVLELTEGTVVEAAYSEYLTDGRVMPVISLSASESCHMDRWIASGGKQTFSTFSPRGFRYLELHIAAPAEVVRLHECSVLQRSYFGPANGDFKCSDSQLNDIWQMCVETLQSCSEDALTDTPTRERGQWLGDAVAVGLEVMGAAYGDLTLIRRSLEQAALCRRSDGMIVGCYPGQIIPVSSYAMLWVSGCLRYHGLTGDLTFMKKHYAAANDVVDFYYGFLTESGIANFTYWDFIDWGHMVAKDEVNIALNVMVWKAIGDLAEWSELLGEAEDAKKRLQQRNLLRDIMRKHMLSGQGLLRTAIPAPSHVAMTDSPEREAGFHANALALRFGFFNGEERLRAVEFIKQHILNCYPNRPDAPRLAHPRANHPQLITPYFAHYSLTALLEAGEDEFVYNQIRECWGWMLQQGATTTLEVFDPRWSHCHAWSGSPAWQLSYYALGLQPVGDGNPFAYRFELHPGSLTHASGVLPIAETPYVIRISWERMEDGILYTCESDQELMITVPNSLPYRIKFTPPLLDNDEDLIVFAAKAFQARIYELA